MTSAQRYKLLGLGFLACVLIAFFFIPIPTHAEAIDLSDPAKAELAMQSAQRELRLLQIASYADLFALGWIARIAWCIVRDATKRPAA